MFLLYIRKGVTSIADTLRGCITPEKGILNMSYTVLYVFRIMAAISFVYFEFKIHIRLLIKSGMFL